MHRVVVRHGVCVCATFVAKETRRTRFAVATRPAPPACVAFLASDRVELYDLQTGELSKRIPFAFGEGKLFTQIKTKKRYHETELFDRLDV